MPQLTVSLNIPTDELLRYYSGKAGLVLAYATDGRKVSFPANLLRPYVTQAGVQGLFAIEFDQNYKFQTIKKLN